MHRSNLTPSAFRYNGTYFEDVVTGYHTLNTRGRYLLEKEITVRESDRANGSVFDFGRYPTREIEVEYFIEADTPEEFQQRYEKLARYMDGEQATIIFNGEDDKYMVGTISAPPSVDEGLFSRSGTYTIVCSDPFKYSIAEYVLDKNSASFTADTNGGSWTFNYNGGYKARPVFTVEFPKTVDTSGNNTDSSKCGFIGFANSNTAVLQFGNPDIEDVVTNPATNPFNKTFSTANAASDMTLNGAAVPGTGYTQAGSVSVNTTSKIVYPSAYGSGTGTHGPSISYILPNTYAKTNFTFTWEQVINGQNLEFGTFMALLYNNNSGTRKLISGIKFEKTERGRNIGVHFLSSNGEFANLTGSNSVPSGSIKDSAITKIGNAITFQTCGKSVSYTLLNSVASLVANEIVFYFGKIKSLTPLNTNGLKSASLTQFSQDNVPGVPNFFMPGDTLKVDTNNAGVYLDSGAGDTPAQSVGALGNNWETFTLKPGANTIAYEYSTFTTTAPNVTMKYREVYI